MPIKPENKHLYLPRKEWAALRADRLAAQGNKCLWCDAPNETEVYRDEFNRWALEGGAHCRIVKIVLAVAHLDHDPRNNTPENTPALCQLCYNRYAAEHRAETRRKTRERNEKGKK